MMANSLCFLLPSLLSIDFFFGIGSSSITAPFEYCVGLMFMLTEEGKKGRRVGVV